MPSGPSNDTTSGPRDPSQTIWLSANTFISSALISARTSGVSGVQNRNGRAASRLDVAVSAITAFGAGVLAGIALHRNDEFGFGFDAPHGIDEVAGVLGAKFQTELAAEFTGA